MISGSLLQFAANDPLGDRRGDGHRRLLPAAEPIGLGVVQFRDELLERGEQRVEPLGDFSSRMRWAACFGGVAAGDFGLAANLLGLLMGLLHNLRRLAADRFQVLVRPAVHVVEVERDRLHRPAGRCFCASCVCE